jgi:hypothetical protein
VAKQRPNDNFHPIVEFLRTRLAAFLPVALHLQTQKACGILMSEGQHWRSAGRNTSAVRTPTKNNDPALSVAWDHIGPIVRQTDGRLRVDDFRATFTTADDELFGMESEEQYTKIRMMEQQHRRWKVRSGVHDHAADLTFSSIIAGYAVARGRFIDDPDLIERLGPWKMEYSNVLTLAWDPASVIQDLNKHEYLISADVIPVTQANQDHKDDLQKRGMYPIESKVRMGALVSADKYLDAMSFSMRPGGFMSATPAIIRYEIWDKYFTRYALVLYCPQWQSETDANDKQEPQYFVVYDTPSGFIDWDYGCPWLKLDHFRRKRCAAGQSLPVSLTPVQNIVNLMMRQELRNVIVQGAQKILAVSGAIAPDQMSRLRSNTPFEVVEISRNHQASEVLPLAINRSDPVSANLGARAIAQMYRMGAIEPIVLGQTSDRQSQGSQTIARDDALIPLHSIAETHQHRWETFLGTMNDASLRHHLLGTRPKTLRCIFGPRFNSVYLRPQSEKREIIESGAVACHMRDAAFRPETPQSIEERLNAWMTAGHINPQDSGFVLQYFLQTGREAEKGQADKYASAMEKVHKALRGDPVDISAYDSHVFIIWLCEDFINQAELYDYTIKQKQSLEQMIFHCDEAVAKRAAHKAAIASQAQALANPAGGPQATGAPSTSAMPMSPQGAPIVGPAVAMAGMR